MVDLDLHAFDEGPFGQELNSRQSLSIAARSNPSSARVSAFGFSSTAVESSRAAGIRTPVVGLELISPSSTAVANIAERAARVFLIADVDLPAERIAPNRSRTSAGSTSESFHVPQRGIASAAIGRRYSGLVVSEKPRAVRPA